MEINTVCMKLEDYRELILENVDLKEQNKKLEKEKKELVEDYERIEKRIFDDILTNNDYMISQIEEFSYEDYFYRKLVDILNEKGYLSEDKIKNIIVRLKSECDKKRENNN